MSMLVFVDESGDQGMKQKPGSSALFVIAAVIFFAPEDANACDDKIQILRKTCFRTAATEFKFNKCCRDHRLAFLKGVSEQEFMYLAFVLNKNKLSGPGFQFKESFYKYASKLLFESAKDYLEGATVVIDGSGDRLFREQLQIYLKKKINTDAQVIQKVKIEASHKNNLLQLADMICGSVARSLRSDKTDCQVYREVLKKKEIAVKIWPKL